MSGLMRGERPSLTAAIQLFRRGEQAAARQMIEQLVILEPGNAQAWAWLAYVAGHIEHKRAALRQALSLNPADIRLREALTQLNTPLEVQRAAVRGVFISYARSDELFAFNLANSLRAGGVNTWLDLTDIPDEADWYTAIRDALSACGLMLVVLSPAALESSDLKAEWLYSARAGKLIQPVLTETCPLPTDETWLAPVDFRYDYGLGVQQVLRLLAGSATFHH